MRLERRRQHVIAELAFAPAPRRGLAVDARHPPRHRAIDEHERARHRELDDRAEPLEPHALHRPRARRSATRTAPTQLARGADRTCHSAGRDRLVRAPAQQRADHRRHDRERGRADEQERHVDAEARRVGVHAPLDREDPTAARHAATLAQPLACRVASGSSVGQRGGARLVHEQELRRSRRGRSATHGFRGVTRGVQPRMAPSLHEVRSCFDRSSASPSCQRCTEPTAPTGDDGTDELAAQFSPAGQA